MDALDGLRDHLARARGILRARHSVTRPYEKCAEHLTEAMRHADDIDAKLRCMSCELTTVRHRLAASEKTLAFVRRQQTPPQTAISLMYCISADGRYLPPMVVYKAQNVYTNWTKRGPSTRCNLRCNTVWVVWLEVLQSLVYGNISASCERPEWRPVIIWRVMHELWVKDLYSHKHWRIATRLGKFTT